MGTRYNGIIRRFLLILSWLVPAASSTLRGRDALLPKQSSLNTSKVYQKRVTTVNIKHRFSPRALGASVVIFFSASAMAQANCGALPDTPALLSPDHITFGQKEALISQMDVFQAQMDSHEACLEAQIMALVAPEDDGSEGFFTSQAYLDYQAQFDALVAVVQQSAAYEQATIDEYNTQLANAVEQAPAN